MSINQDLIRALARKASNLTKRQKLVTVKQFVCDAVICYKSLLDSLKNILAAFCFACLSPGLAEQ